MQEWVQRVSSLKYVMKSTTKKTLPLELELLVDLRVQITVQEKHYRSRDMLGQVQAWGIHT